MLQFGANLTSLLVVGAYVLALVVLFATDLDQRLLPDILTLPMVAFAIAVFVLGASPFLKTNDDVIWALGAAVVVPLALFLLSVPFGRGAIGQGDLKLLVSVGLFAGSGKLFYALVSGALGAGIVVAVLLATRRISMKSYVPYGPFLIAGTLWAILALTQP